MASNAKFAKAEITGICGAPGRRMSTKLLGDAAGGLRPLATRLADVAFPA